ncbi:hypothetical protein CSX04_06232 [Burkholderia cepacia]|nr:hypothetical protein CSX04_06232 [Burkholderia cepacia]
MGGRLLRCGLTGGVGDVREPRVDQVQQRVARRVGRGEARRGGRRRGRIRMTRGFVVARVGHARELRGDRRVAGLAFGEQEQRAFERAEFRERARRVASHVAAGRTHDGS